MQSLLACFFAALSLGCLWVWIGGLRRVVSGKPLWESQPADVKWPWGLSDLLVAFLLFVAAQASAGEVVSRVYDIAAGTRLEQMSVRVRAAVLLASSLGTASAFLGAVVWLRYRYRARLAEFGIQPRRVAADLKIGALGFLLLAPVVYGVQWLLVQWFESKHPLIELLRADPDPQFMVLSAFAALLVAPLAEEFLFRLLLQGWLERVAEGAQPRDLLLGGPSENPEKSNFDRNPPAGSTQSITVAADQADKTPPADPHKLEDRADMVAAVPSAGGGRRFWPILVSSSLFALVHSSHGPDPVPLFLFAIGLGIVFQRTRRILPCIVLHFLLNACSLLVLWFVIYAGLE